MLQYAQLDKNKICVAITTAHISEIIADESNLGQKRLDDGTWEDVLQHVIPAQPTNAEVAQLISDLQADLIIAGVI